MTSSFRRLVERLEVDSPDSDFAQVVQAAQEGLGDDEIAALARRLADSGERPPAGRGRKPRADLASTGGPGSLSTLICPLALSASGCEVPKVGVPGRPAGGVDVLATIPGYRVDLDSSEAAEMLKRTPYVHMLAGPGFAPLDRRLFDYRKRSGAIAVPELVVASLLAKKLAVGVEAVGLDARVAPHGNFGSTVEQAEANARLFVNVSALLGIRAVCFLTDALYPPQPYLGRGESLVALSQFLDGRAEADLASHASLCREMAQEVAGAAHAPDAELIRSSFFDNVRAQGSDEDAFHRRVEEVRRSPAHDLAAPAAGVVSWDLAALRDAIVARQTEAVTPTFPFPDPAGVTLMTPDGEPVQAGEAIAKVRATHGSSQFADQVARAARPRAKAAPLTDRGLLAVVRGR